LIGEGSRRGGSQKYCDSNHLPDSVGLECHISFWRGKEGAPIARRMGFLGIGVVAVPVPKNEGASLDNPNPDPI
jgi:hypothetical protein